jgi:peptide deformylase
MSGNKKMDNESCLSLPGILMKKERDVEIRVRYQDYLGAVNTKVFTNFTARVFQHEFDHLQGITLLSGLSKLKLDMAMKKAKKLGVKYRMEALQNERSE